MIGLSPFLPFARSRDRSTGQAGCLPVAAPRGVSSLDFARSRCPGSGHFSGEGRTRAGELFQRGGEALACLALCALPFVLAIVVLALIVRGKGGLAHDGDDAVTRRPAQRESRASLPGGAP